MMIYKGVEHFSWTLKDKFLVEMKLLMQFMIFPLQALSTN